MSCEFCVLNAEHTCFAKSKETHKSLNNKSVMPNHIVRSKEDKNKNYDNLKLTNKNQQTITNRLDLNQLGRGDEWSQTVQHQ